MIYSFLVRQFLRDWKKSFGLLIGEMLGTDRVLLQSVFPGNVGVLQERLPGGHPLADKDTLCISHSVIPLLALFEPEKSVEEIKRRWFEGKLHSLRVFLGLNHSRFELSAKCLRYCHSCVVEDRFGLVPPLPMWRIVHQLPSVYVCPKHDDRLVEGCRECGGPRWSRMATNLPGVCECGETTVFRRAQPPYKVTPAQLRRLAKWTNEALLSEPITELSAYDSYFIPAFNAICASAKGRVTTKRKTYQKMLSLYGETCLAHFGIRSCQPKPSDGSGVAIGKSIVSRAMFRLLAVSTEFSSLAEVRCAVDEKLVRDELPVTPRRTPRDENASWSGKLPKLFEQHSGHIGAISKALGRSEGTVRLACLRAGLIVDQPVTEDDRRIVSMLRRGEEKKYIAAECNVRIKRVDRVCSSVAGLQQAWERASFRRYQKSHRHSYLQRSREGVNLEDDRKTRRAYDWLKDNDSAWLGRQQKRRAASAEVGRLKRRVDKASAITRRKELHDRWHEEDEELKQWIARRAAEWTSAPPDFRMSWTALLGDHPLRHALNQTRIRFPGSVKVLHALEEDPDSYIKRRIRASLGAKKQTHLPAWSKRSFARESGISEQMIRRYWPYVLSQLGIAADGSVKRLSPSRKSREP